MTRPLVSTQNTHQECAFEWQFLGFHKQILIHEVWEWGLGIIILKKQNDCEAVSQRISFEK